MRTELSREEAITGFELLNVHKLNPEKILGSQIPEEVILAILGEYEREKAEGLIRRIIERLKELCGNEARFNKYIKQLTVLSRLRNLEVETKKTVEQMPITYDITKDGLFLEGKKEGKREGKKEGKREGKKEGIKEGVLKERKRRNLEVAKNLKRAGVEIKIISESTGLSLAEIKKL